MKPAFVKCHMIPGMRSDFYLKGLQFDMFLLLLMLITNFIFENIFNLYFSNYHYKGRKRSF